MKALLFLSFAPLLSIAQNKTVPFSPDASGKIEVRNVAKTYGIKKGDTIKIRGIVYRVFLDSVIDGTVIWWKDTLPKPDAIPVPPNAPPAVAIVSPQPAQVFAAPANVLLKATATDPAGISKVEFYINGVLKYTEGTSPYERTHAMAAGSHTFRARAYDKTGLVSEKIISFTVKAPAPTPVNDTTYIKGNYTLKTTDKIIKFTGSVASKLTIPVKLESGRRYTIVNRSAVNLTTSVQLVFDNGQYRTTVRPNEWFKIEFRKKKHRIIARN